MPKQSDNFLRGWTRQLRAAVDDGGELAYETAELIEECLDLLVPDRDSDREVDDSDEDGVGGADDACASAPSGRQQNDQPGVSGLGTLLEPSPRRDNPPPRVPRGTGSGASLLAARAAGIDTRPKKACRGPRGS